MSSGSGRSPIPLESDSDESVDVHPVDAVIQAAISRQQSPASGADRLKRATKRKREVSQDVDVISLPSSSGGESSASGKSGAQQKQTSPPRSKGIPAAGVAPIGVTVVEEGGQTRNAEVQRLLRGTRQVSYCGLCSYQAWQKISKLQPLTIADRLPRFTGFPTACSSALLTALQPRASGKLVQQSLQYNRD